MIENTCCVTGHRNIPANKKGYVGAELKKDILVAAEDGYTRFISGFAEGADLIFAALAIELKARGHTLTLEAAILYAGRLKSRNPSFREILSLCDKVNVLCDKFSHSCYFVRNRYLVDQSSRVIVVYDGRENGGTSYTIHYASTQGRTIRVIKI